MQYLKTALSSIGSPNNVFLFKLNTLYPFVLTILFVLYLNNVTTILSSMYVFIYPTNYILQRDSNENICDKRFRDFCTKNLYEI